ncbi:MAG: thioredoxin family protein [bacterium]|nr:thioredoxin family protein [bacterium]
MTLKTIFVLLIAVVLLVAAGCNSNEPPQPNEVKPSELAWVKIAGNGSFPEGDCEERGTKNSIIMLESKYCSHCKKTKPDFLEACKEKGVEPIILDLAEKEGINQLDTYKIQVAFTPTFIFGCDYFTGAKSKEEYLKYIDELL